MRTVKAIIVLNALGLLFNESRSWPGMKREYIVGDDISGLDTGTVHTNCCVHRDSDDVSPRPANVYYP